MMAFRVSFRADFGRSCLEFVKLRSELEGSLTIGKVSIDGARLKHSWYCT